MFTPLQQVYIDSLRTQLDDTRLNVSHTIPESLETDKWWNDEWNRIHCKCVDLRNDFFADYCEKVILEAKKYYYTSGKTIMSDERYDRFEMALKSLRPSSKVLEKVGT